MRSRSIAVIVGVLAHLANSTLAQEPPRFTTPEWSWNAPGTDEEIRQFATRYWYGIETGDLCAAMQGFSFTQPLPSDPEILFRNEIRIFEDLYSHRLNLDPLSPGFYSVADLVRDDAVVRAQFRELTTTGKIQTPMADDQTAAIKHVQAVADALLAQEKYTLSGAFIVDGVMIQSEGLKSVPPPVAPTPAVPPATPTPPAPDSILPTIKTVYNWSFLQCMSDQGFHVDLGVNNRPYGPTFMCRDYAWALIAWMKRCRDHGLPANTEFFYVGINYNCSNGYSSGHAVVVIKYMNCFYVIDPQTGEADGPVCTAAGTSSEDIRKKVNELIIQYLLKLRERGKYPFCTPATPTFETPSWTPDPATNPPASDRWTLPWWWRDRSPNSCALPATSPENVWEKFKAALKKCCDAAAAPATIPPTPSISPNHIQPPVGSPDPCDPNQYTLPGY